MKRTFLTIIKVVLIGSALQAQEPNHAPFGYDDNYRSAGGVPLEVPAPGLLGNDHDPDGDSLTAVLERGPSNGRVVLNPDGSFVYTANPNYSGTDSFIYKVRDAQHQTSLLLAIITVGDEPGRFPRELVRADYAPVF